MNYNVITNFERRSRARAQSISRTRFGQTLLTVGRILLALSMVLGAFLLVSGAAQLVASALGIMPQPSVQSGGVPSASLAVVSFVGGLVGTLAVIGGYGTYVRIIEHRPVTEFGRHGATRSLVAGALLGAGLFTAAVGIVWLAGGYEITGINPWLIIVPAIMGAAFWATLEEIVYRGILLRITEEKLGTWVALGLSSLVFGGFHLVATPNATLWTGVSVFVAGLWLGGAYLYTRRLWFPIALHAAWNFAQGAIFGIAVSGDEAGQGLFVGSTSGPTWLSGGAYGLEGSVIAVAIIALAAVIVLWQARQQDRFVSSNRRLSAGQIERGRGH